MGKNVGYVTFSNRIELKFYIPMFQSCPDITSKFMEIFLDQRQLISSIPAIYD